VIFKKCKEKEIFLILQSTIFFGVDIQVKTDTFSG